MDLSGTTDVTVPTHEQEPDALTARQAAVLNELDDAEPRPLSSDALAVTPAGSVTPPMVTSRVSDLDPPTSRYMMSVNAPHWPFCASSVPMNANLRFFRIVSAVTSTLEPEPADAG